MLTIFIFISSSTFYSKVLPFIELLLKTGSNFLLFCFYCYIVFIIILYKKWGLEFLIKLAHNCTSSKNCHSGQGFPSGGGGDWGTPVSSISSS